jgi:carboxymethylenebutenolidase
MMKLIIASFYLSAFLPFTTDGFSLYNNYSAGVQAQAGNQESENSALDSTTTGIKTSTIKYISGNDTIAAYLAEPEGEGPFPALIVIHEWWGLTNWIKQSADNFAKRGYVALAVDLYRGESTDNPDVARELSGSLSGERAVNDLISAFDYLQNKPNVNKEKIGSIGWCFGGGYSLQTALNENKLAACVICYGRLVTDKNQVEKIPCPVLGIFGEKDPNITPKVVDGFKDALNKAGKQNKIIDYPGVTHAFMNPGNKHGYSKETTEHAWNEIFSFLEKNLK